MIYGGHRIMDSKSSLSLFLIAVLTRQHMDIMRLVSMVRRKYYWLLIIFPTIYLLWRQYSTKSEPAYQTPAIKKSFINRGKDVVLGPFLSESHRQVQTNHSITLASHTSLRNLYHLQLIGIVWKSPISVAVWTRGGDITALVELAYILTISCAGRSSVSISILTPSSAPLTVREESINWEEVYNPTAYTCTQRNLHNKFYSLRASEPYENYNTENLAYPNNRLRNLALSTVTTSHVLVTDIDIIPSVSLDQQFMQFLHLSGRVLKDPVFVVPVFESKNSRINQWTLSRLMDEWQSGTVRQFYVETCPQCQGPTQYTSWIDRQSHSTSQPMTSVKSVYVPGWEPFVILRTATHPKYDERFQRFGYNRMSAVCELYMSGRSFYVLDKGFLVHDGFKVEDGFHADKDRELKANELLYKEFRSELTVRYNTNKQC